MAKTKGVILYPDNTYQEKEFDGLKDLQDAVGGLIEHLPLRGASAFINEDGKRLELDFNNLATLTALLSGSITYWDNIKGNMVLVGESDDEGENTDISDYWLTTVKLFWERKA